MKIKEYDKYLNGLISGDSILCGKIVADLLDNDVDIKELYVSLFQKSLYDVGEMWAVNKVSVATEHIATATTESLLHLAYPRIFMAEHIGKRAVIACVANEYHQIGGKMIADILELNGWDAFFVGANSPLENLMYLIEEKQPDLVGLSLSLQHNLDSLLSAISAIREMYPSLPTIVGGQAFRHGNIQELNCYNEVTIIGSLFELEEYIQGF